MFRLLSMYLVVTCLGLFSVGASAAIPNPLPTNWIIFDSNRCQTPVSGVCETVRNYGIYAQNLTTGVVEQITYDGNYDSWWPKLSPDRKKVLFYRTDAGLKENDSFRRTSLWVLPVDGLTAPTKLIGAARGPGGTNAYGWTLQAHAEWSPSQNSIVQLASPASPMAGAPLQIYTVPFTDDTTSPFTGYSVGPTPTLISRQSGGGMRPGVNLDPSFTTDGNYVVFISCPNADGNAVCDAGNPQELILTSIGGTWSETQLTKTNDGTINFDPYYNTDGGQIGWLSGVTCNRWGIRHSPWYGLMPWWPGTDAAVVINDGAINSKPSWINSNTMYFHRWPMAASTVWTVNASNWSGGLLEPSPNLDVNCQTDGVTSATPSSLVVADPTGLSTDTILFNSNRCITGSPACPLPTVNWKLYRWTPVGGVNTTPLSAGTTGCGYTGGGAAAEFDYYDAKISPNRKQLLYFRSPRGEKGNRFSQELWVMDIASTGSGSGATPLICSGDTGNAFSWVAFADASWGPSGDRIVLSASTAAQETLKSSQIYRLNYNAVTKAVSSATRLSYGNGAGTDRPKRNSEPSYSPDGTTVVYTGCALNGGRTDCDAARSSSEIVKTSAASATGESVITTTSDFSIYHGPVYSPSGTTIAAVHSLTCSSTEVVQMTTSGAPTIPATSLSGALHIAPQWSYDGTKLLFTALPNDFRSINYQINANVPAPGGADDGTPIPPTAVTASTPCSSEFPNAGR